MGELTNFGNVFQNFQWPDFPAITFFNCRILPSPNNYIFQFTIKLETMKLILNSNQILKSTCGSVFIYVSLLLSKKKKNVSVWCDLKFIKNYVILEIYKKKM